jgi:hypothetical protein
MVVGVDWSCIYRSQGLREVSESKSTCKGFRNGKCDEKLFNFYFIILDELFGVILNIGFLCNFCKTHPFDMVVGVDLWCVPSSPPSPCRSLCWLYGENGVDIRIMMRAEGPKKCRCWKAKIDDLVLGTQPPPVVRISFFITPIDRARVQLSKSVLIFKNGQKIKVLKLFEVYAVKTGKS